ncbi:MAG: hypothetical protein Q9165_003653 [Trypethelium subeluteriae]
MEIPYQMDFADQYYEKTERKAPRPLPSLGASYQSQESPCPVTPPHAAEHDEQSFQHALQSIKAEIQEMNSYYSNVLRDVDKTRAPPMNTTMLPVQPQPQPLPQPGAPTFWQLFQALRTDVRGLDARLELLETRYERLEERLSLLEPGTPPETPAPSTTQLVDLDPPEIASSTTAWPLQGEKGDEDTVGALPLATPEDIGYFDPKDGEGTTSRSGDYHDVMFFVEWVRRVAKEKRILCLRSCLRNRALTWWLTLDADTRHAMENGNVELACNELVRHFALSQHEAMVELVHKKYTEKDITAGRKLYEDYGLNIYRFCLHARFKGEQFHHMAKMFMYHNIAPSLFSYFPEPIDDPSETALDYLHKLQQRESRVRNACHARTSQPPPTDPPKRHGPPILTRLSASPSYSSSSSTDSSSTPPKGGPPPPPLPPKKLETPQVVRFMPDVPPSPENAANNNTTAAANTTTTTTTTTTAATDFANNNNNGPPPPPPPAPPHRGPPPYPSSARSRLANLHRSQSLHHLPPPGPLTRQGRHNPYTAEYVTRHRPNPYRSENGGASSGGEGPVASSSRAESGGMGAGASAAKSMWQAYVEDEDRAYQRALRNSKVEY